MAKSYYTYKYRIKDENDKKLLRQMAFDVNFVWNHTNAFVRKRWNESRTYTTAYDAAFLVAGASEVLSVNSQTCQATIETLIDALKQNKGKIRFRSSRIGGSLGWVPFKGQTFKMLGEMAKYNGHKFRVWLGKGKKQRPLPEGAKIKSGCFRADARGRWYLCVVVEETRAYAQAPIGTEIGLDPGLRTILTDSRGRKYSRENLTKKYQEKLARAQQRQPKNLKKHKGGNKRRTVQKVHAKIRNSRLDFAHKLSTQIAKENRLVIAGDVDSSILETGPFLAKSMYDAGWYELRAFLKHKCHSRSGLYIEINEKDTTRTCSSCGDQNGPTGLRDLAVVEWKCAKCGETHDRDINAAINILRFGRESLVGANLLGIPSL